MKIDNRKAIVSIFMFLCNYAALALDYSKTLDKYIEEDLAFAKYVTIDDFESTQPIARILLVQWKIESKNSHAHNLFNGIIEKIERIVDNKELIAEEIETFAIDGALENLPKTSRYIKCHGKKVVKKSRLCSVCEGHGVYFGTHLPCEHCKKSNMHGSPSNGNKIWLVPCPRCFKQK